MALLSGAGFPATSLALLAAPLAVVGLLDDCHNLPASWRYGVQLLTAVLMLGFSPLVQRCGLAIGSGSWLLLPVLALVVIAVTAVINFTNFMDGLDGLVAGCMVVTIAALSQALAAPWPLWALVGSLLGFLLWNWSPANVFMGDVGSTFLGAVFAGLVLQASSWPQALGLLLVATPLLGDACLCLPRRLLAGQRVFQAHRLHLFQRLHQATRPAGPMPACRSRTSLPRRCWPWPCWWAAGPGCSAWLLWSCWLGCGWISVWRCRLLWRLRADGIRAQGDAVLGFPCRLQAPANAAGRFESPCASASGAPQAAPVVGCRAASHEAPGAAKGCWLCRGQGNSRGCRCLRI